MRAQRTPLREKSSTVIAQKRAGELRALPLYVLDFQHHQWTCPIVVM
jgi:hypothetical protein